jgi:hypothetical protein
MKFSRTAFLELLFDEGQASCFTESPHGYKVHMTPAKDDLFFCINALHPTEDLAPTKDWHSQYRPRRADANIVCYRNFLLEMDNMALDAQIKYVTDLVPVSSIVYSGGKSYHFIISLETAIDAETYRTWAKRLHLLVKEADPQCKNASRLSRLPDVVRPETGKTQELIELRTRINNSELEGILPELPVKPKVKYSAENKLNYVPQLVMEACIFPDDIMDRFELGGRNAFFFWLFNRMNEAQVAEGLREDYVERAYSNLRDVSDFSLEEARSAARLQQ